MELLSSFPVIKPSYRAFFTALSLFMIFSSCQPSLTGKKPQNCCKRQNSCMTCTRERKVNWLGDVRSYPLLFASIRFCSEGTPKERPRVRMTSQAKTSRRVWTSYESWYASEILHANGQITAFIKSARWNKVDESIRSILLCSLAERHMKVISCSSVNDNRARSPSCAALLWLSPVFTALLVALFAVLELFIKSLPSSVKFHLF